MAAKQVRRAAEILLVEDNPADVRFVSEAVKETGLRCNLSVAGDGEQALAFLRREEPYADAPRPDLVLLDLNLPKLSGREVLGQIKTDPRLKTIPVIILTTSADAEDLLRAYQQSANGYVTKPVDLDQYVKIIGGIEDYWFNIVSLPDDT